MSASAWRLAVAMFLGLLAAGGAIAAEASDSPDGGPAQADAAPAAASSAPVMTDVRMVGDDKRTRFVAALMGNTAPGRGWVEPFMVRDRKLARRQVDRMLGWDIDGVILGHGALLESGGHAALDAAYRWL